jgi:hypothetical protein
MAVAIGFLMTGGNSVASVEWRGGLEAPDAETALRRINARASRMY